jgi:hypothetical protein
LKVDLQYCHEEDELIMRIIIEIDSKEFALKGINTENDNSGIPKITTEAGEFTSKDVPPPPQELLNLAKSIGALNAGPAPSWISQSTESSISKTEFDDQEVIDAGSMMNTSSLSNQKAAENSLEKNISDDQITSTLDAGNFQGTNDQ